MDTIKKKKPYRAVLFCAFLSAIFFLLPCGRARAYSSKEWQDRIAERTAVLWVEGQMLGDDIVLSARGELRVTWLERGLSRALRSDREVDEWVIDALNYYSSNRKETRTRLEGRDTFALTYRAIKNWDFDPTKLTIGEYSITPEDILTRKGSWASRVAPGYIGTVTVSAPSLKPGQTVELRYEDTSAALEIPRSRAR